MAASIDRVGNSMDKWDGGTIYDLIFLILDFFTTRLIKYSGF